MNSRMNEWISQIELGIYLLKIITADNLAMDINSLAPGEIDYSLKLGNFKLISRINIVSIFCEIPIRWMPQDLTDY